MSNGQAQAGKATPKWHVGSLERFFRRSGLFRWPLKRHESLKVRSGLPDPWRGNAAAGAIILANGIDWIMKPSMAMIFPGLGICGLLAAANPPANKISD